MEIWRPIKGYEGLYEVSDQGNVRSLPRIVNNNGGCDYRDGRMLKKHKNKSRNDYESVLLSKEGNLKRVTVHRLVAYAFSEVCGEWFDGCEIDHLNCITTDNRAVNLRVCTKRENMNNPLTKVNCSKGWTDERRKKTSERMKNNNPVRYRRYA